MEKKVVTSVCEWGFRRTGQMGSSMYYGEGEMLENGWTKALEEKDKQIAALERTATDQTECLLHFQARVATLTAEVVKWNPCDHSGFESVSCGICGYPDPKKLIKYLRGENERLKILCAELIGPDVKKEIE